jgi:catechol 2,3-dioxygenase-like lactoylglutathione lyase family enzyme
MVTKGSATTLQVSHLEASLAFYIAILGLTERFRLGDYAAGEVQIHFSGPAATNKRQIGQGSIYIFCDDVDAYYSEFLAKGATTQAPPKDYDYGMRDFAIEDPDGNLLGFGQEVAQSS